MTHPKLLNRFNCESKGENNKRIKNQGTLFDSQHFEDRKMCYNSKMKTKTSDKWVNYSHGPA
jgi:hypothetical protein